MIPGFSHVRSQHHLPRLQDDTPSDVNVALEAPHEYIWILVFVISTITGWWLSPSPLKNDGVRQLGLWNSQLYGKIKHIPNRQPDKQILVGYIYHNPRIAGTYDKPSASYISYSAITIWNIHFHHRIPAAPPTALPLAPSKGSPRNLFVGSPTKHGKIWKPSAMEWEKSSLLGFFGHLFLGFLIREAGKTYTQLVGGLNPSEKYESQWEGLSHLWWKIKNVSIHQPDSHGKWTIAMV